MSVVNGTKPYCICQASDDGRPMIHCDNCDKWYHFDCIDLNEDTAAEIELFYCQPCTEQTNQTTKFSWQLTDDELSFAPRAAEAIQAPKPRAKTRTSHAASVVKQAPSPVVPTPAPTFAVHDSDSDVGGQDDDGEYTGERQLTRLRRGRQARRAGSESDRSPSPDAKARKRKATSTLTSTSKRKRTLVAKSPSPLSDPVRKYCYGKLHEVIEPIFLEYRADSEVSDEVAKSLAAKYVAQLEDAVFKQYSEPDKKGKAGAGPKYKERFRMLTFNVGQSDRMLLRRGIGTGEISASDLSEMSSADLANEQAKQDMEKAAQEALHQSILKVQTALPRAKITHKGEEIIESNASEDLRVAREEEEQERVRTRLRIRTGSILESPESAAAISSAARMPSSVFGGNHPAEMIDGTPTSPEKMFSPDGAAIHGTTSFSPIIGSHIVSSPVQETSSPLNEALVSPRTAVHTSRPSFDLNSLWSRQAGERSQRDHASAMPDVKNFGEDDDEVAMDLDDEQPGEEDFGMFLDGVEEKGNANSSAVRSTTPPPPVAEGLDALPVVWSGELVMPQDPHPALINTVSVKQVGGRSFGSLPEVWSLLFRSNRALIEGRVPTERSTKYLLTTRLNSSKELVVVLFTPTETSKGNFTELFDFLIKKDRHGLIFPWGTQPPSSAPGKDLYLIPLQPSRPLPEFIDLLDHVQIPKKRDENMLLGVFVLSKGKIVVPAPAPIVDTPAMIAPQSAAPQPVLRNDTISSLFSALGNTSTPGIGPGVSATPMPGMPGIPPMMPQPMQAPGIVYPYGPPPPMPLPTSTITPPAAALNALSSSLKNMSQEQINLILKGLSMANAAAGPPANPVMPMAPPMSAPWPPVTPPHANPMYGGVPPPIPPNYNPYAAPQMRSPQMSRSPDRRDENYSRDRERRASPPFRGRDGRPRDREERGRGGRDRRGGGPSFAQPSDSGWSRKRAAAPTGHGHGQ